MIQTCGAKWKCSVQVCLCWLQLQLHRNSFVSCSPPLWFVTFTSLRLVVETAMICTMMNLVMFLVLCWKSTLFSSTKLWPFFPNLLSSLLSLALVLLGWLCRELLAYMKALYPLESRSFRLWCWVLFVLIYESCFLLDRCEMATMSKLQTMAFLPV
jgi:hypothetical protein